MSKKVASKKSKGKKKYIPQSIRRMQMTHKVVKSLQKHQDTYLTGLYALVHTVGQFLKKTK